MEINRSTGPRRAFTLRMLMRRLFLIGSNGRALLIVAFFVMMLNGARAEAQLRVETRDSVLNGAVIGAATGAGIGVAFTHAVRDSDLTFSQYARGALIFGAIGAGVGLGMDALLQRKSPQPIPTRRRIVVAPVAWRNTARFTVRMRW